ncbi:hypothetical protein D3C72_1973270 [compost metagenome]
MATVLSAVDSTRAQAVPPASLNNADNFIGFLPSHSSGAICAAAAIPSTVCVPPECTVSLMRYADIIKRISDNISSESLGWRDARPLAFAEP